MRLKSTLIFGLALLLFSCGQKNGNNETHLSESMSKNETISLYQQKLNIVLADPSIDEYYKEIYRQEKLIPGDDYKMLSITENLSTNDPDKDLFYFVVFTKSMNGSDGFYSEAVGLSAFKFVTTKTEQFADYFNYVTKITDQDMDNWAQFIYGEIQISRENQKEKTVKELEKQLLENIKEARKEYRVIIERFIEKVKSTMH